MTLPAWMTDSDWRALDAVAEAAIDGDARAALVHAGVLDLMADARRQAWLARTLGRPVHELLMPAALRLPFPARATVAGAGARRPIGDDGEPIAAGTTAGTWRPPLPDETGMPAIVLPVDEPAARPPELARHLPGPPFAALLALDPDDPDRWWTDAPLDGLPPLGCDALWRDAPADAPLGTWASPLEWLAADPAVREAGCCPLDLDAFLVRHGPGPAPLVARARDADRAIAWAERLERRRRALLRPALPKILVEGV